MVANDSPARYKAIPVANLTQNSHRFEYLALFGSLVLVLLETVIHLITFCLRESTKRLGSSHSKETCS